MAELPDPTTWLADAAINTLRQWIRDGSPHGGTFLTFGDLDHLEDWIAGLAEAHAQTLGAFDRAKIEVGLYPVRIPSHQPEENRP